MFVVVGGGGQLCNRLTLSAHVLAAALERGHAFAAPGLDEYADLFEAPGRDLLSRHPARPTFLPRGPLARRLARRAARSASSAVRKLPLGLGLAETIKLRGGESLSLDGEPLRSLAARRRVLFFDGWLFRAPEALRRHAGAVRRHFTARQEHRDRAAAILRGAREGRDLLVGVHVRRGDYKAFQGGRYYWEPATYGRLMRAVEALHPGRRVGFLVATNEPLGPADFGVPGVVVAGGSAIVDLCALSGCDLLLGPPSTFSAWASFHGGVPLHVVESPDAPLDASGFSPHWL